MKKINVIDLDNTLLPYDSFRKYILMFLRNKHSALHILTLMILRKLRLIDSAAFKKRVIERSRKIEKYDNKMNNLSNQLFKDIDISIIEAVKSYTDSETVNILCSASPEDYVKGLAELLGWQCVASRLSSVQNYFDHMHGRKKIETIKKIYPPDRFKHNFAISDSRSDEELLMSFDFRILCEKANRKNSRMKRFHK
jgi:phosphoserine phosphatase